jgi:hypothetical protein
VSKPAASKAEASSNGAAAKKPAKAKATS